MPVNKKGKKESWRRDFLKKKHLVARFLMSQVYFMPFFKLLQWCKVP